MNRYKFSYSRKPKKNRIKDILIPSKNSIPAFVYNKNIKTITKESLINNKVELNIKHWGKFSLRELFEITLSKGDLMLKNFLNGTIPLVSAGNTNNGIVGFIDENGDGLAQIFSKNKITVDMFGKSYYQPHDFYAVSHGRVNILTPKFNMNQFIALFICSIINSETYRFSYGRAAYSNVIGNLQIKLPTTPQGNPDWEFMENYIKSLPYSKNLEH